MRFNAFLRILYNLAVLIFHWHNEQNKAIIVYDNPLKVVNFSPFLDIHRIM